MAAIFQIRRGTTAQKPTLVAGEMYVDQSSENLIIGVDGSKEITLLKLNDINTGSLHLTGDIRLSGSIYLGNETADNISALGVFTTNLVPSGDSTKDVGTTSAKWRNVYATNISGAIAATNGVVSGSSQLASVFEEIASSTHTLVSGSSQIIGILDSLNTFSGSQLTQNTALATISGSLILTASANTNSITNLNLFTSSQLTQNSTLATYTGSVESRFTSLATISGSLISTASSHEVSINELNSWSGSARTKLSNLESKSASVDTSISNINSYTSSLKTAISLNGQDVTVNGNLSVLGTTTQINSTQVNIGENILELNYGGSATIAGLYTKDATGGSTTSGSLLWDATNDYWKAGVKDNESKVLLAGGDNVFTSSLQLTNLNQTTSSLNTTTASLNLFSSSVTASLVSIYQTTASLNLFSASVTASLEKIYQTTASLNTYTTSVNADLESIHQTTASLNLFSASVTSSLVSIYQTTASLNVASASLQTFSSSTLSRLNLLEVSTGSLNTFTSSTLTRLNLLETSTGSLNEFTSSQLTQNIALATITGSLVVSASQSYVSASLMTASVKKLREDVDYLYGIGGISGGNPLTPIQEWSASARVQLYNLELFTSSANIRLNNLESTSASVNTSISNINTTTASLNVSVSNINSFTQSSAVRLSNLETTSASVNVSIAQLNTYSASLKTAIGVSGQNVTINGDLTVAGTTTQINSTTLNIGDNIIQLNGTGATNAGLVVRDATGGTTTSGSLLWDTSNDRWIAGPLGSEAKVLTDGMGVISGSGQLANYETTGRGIVSGSSQIVLLLPTGVVSGSIQILGGSGIWSSSTQMPAGVVSGSSQVIGILDSLNSFTSSLNATYATDAEVAAGYEAKGRGIFSGSSQIPNTSITNAQLANSSITIAGTSVSLGNSITAATILGGTNVLSSSAQITAALPSGVVSGSSQIDLTATTNYASGILTRLNVVGVVSGSSQINLGSATGNITLATQTTGDYVASLVQGTGVTITNNSGENATPTIAIGQAVGTSSNVQFGSIGVGTAASGVSGEIRATGDIVAFYSSDERLKENIQPIQNAVDKINQMGGYNYDWKEGFETIHSHKGHDLGVIAQEVQSVLPEVVTERETGYLAVDYVKLVPVLIEAIKELSAKIDRLENK